MPNDLQRLLQLKQTTTKKFADDLSVGYHSLQKVIKGTRKTPSVRQAVASYFNVTTAALWGKRSHAVVKYLMEREIEHQAAGRREELRTRYLKSQAA